MVEGKPPELRLPTLLLLLTLRQCFTLKGRLTCDSVSGSLVKTTYGQVDTAMPPSLPKHSTSTHTSISLGGLFPRSEMTLPLSPLYVV